MTDEQHLRVRTEKVDDRVTVLTAAGELDRDTMAVLGAAAGAALDAGATRLVLDLAPLTFCDSSGLRLFVELHRRTSLHLAGVRPPVATVIQVVNLDRMLALHPTVEEAIG
jgi:anti-sigma B factor antagonist